jgi:inosine-uridine nucleoside N-ribohydrolase
MDPGIGDDARTDAELPAPPRRAWVLDTDLGHDPDDIVALVLLVRAAAAAREPLAVVTCAEVHGDMRARVVRRLLRALLAGEDVLVAAGSAANEIRQGLAAGLARALELDAGGADAAPVGTLADVARFVATQRADRRAVCWVGIGAASNLAALLGDATPDAALPSRAVVMMGAWPSPGIPSEVETNVRMDPAAARAVLANAARRRVPLAVVPLDTTGFGLEWLSALAAQPGSAARHSAPAEGDCGRAVSELLAREPAAAHAVCASTSGHMRDGPVYTAASSLHDPLTVVLALDGGDDGSAAPAFASLFARARVELSPDGVVKRIAVDGAAFERRRSAKNACVLPAFWTHSDYGGRYTILGAEDATCTIALGPLTVVERAQLLARIGEISELRAPRGRPAYAAEDAAAEPAVRDYLNQSPESRKVS